MADITMKEGLGAAVTPEQWPRSYSTTSRTNRLC
jgi:hypothetical protein